MDTTREAVPAAKINILSKIHHFQHRKKEQFQPVKERFPGFFPAFPKAQNTCFQHFILAFRSSRNKLAPGKALYL